MLTAVAALIGLGIGAVVATALLMFRSGSRVHVAEREAETIRREAQIEARELAVTLRAEIEDEVQGRRAEVAKIDERVRQVERELEQKTTEVTRREQGLADREVHVKQLQEDLKTAKDEAVTRAREGRRADGRRGEAPSARALGGSDPARARPQRPAAGGGGPDRGEAARAGAHRRRAPARRGQSHGRDDGDRRRASLRRHEGAHHRPRGSQHPGARAPDGRRLHHRRHSAGGRPLVVRRPPPRGGADDAREADRGRPHPPGPDRGDVLPLEGGARGPRPPGGRAGGLRGEVRRVPRGARQGARQAALPDELRPARAQAHARGRAPDGDHGQRAGSQRQDGEARGAPPRHRQGDDARGRGLARRRSRRSWRSATARARVSSTRSRRTTTRCSRRRSRPCC